MNKAFFVTSTGTDIGKTFVTSNLIRSLRHAGLSVSALKPILTGFSLEDAMTNDSAQILAALGISLEDKTLDEISPWRFEAALAPSMAARLERKTIDESALITYCRRVIDGPSDVAFIEGVGGVMCPIAGRFTILDLIASLETQTILVTGSYLGTLSHTLTAIQVLESRGRGPRLIVLSESPASSVSLDQSRSELQELQEAAVIAVPRDASRHPEAFTEIMNHLSAR